MSTLMARKAETNQQNKAENYNKPPTEIMRPVTQLMALKH